MKYRLDSNIKYLLIVAFIIVMFIGVSFIGRANEETKLREGLFTICLSQDEYTKLMNEDRISDEGEIYINQETINDYMLILNYKPSGFKTLIVE